MAQKKVNAVIHSQEKLAEEARIQAEKEAEEARIRAEQLARDRAILAPEIMELERFSGALEARKALRAETMLSCRRHRCITS